MSWTEAKEYFDKNDIAILPVGSNEQHGPHNPLGTDHLIAKAMAEEAAKRTGVVCLQVIPFGVSVHHKQFCGTIDISPSAFENYVKDVCLSLRRWGVKKIVIVNGHGGNLSALEKLAIKLRKYMFISIFQWWSAARKLLPNMFAQDERAHACAEETSVNLALHAHLVNMEKALDEIIPRHPAEAAGVMLPLFTADLSSSGVWGKSTTASAEKGKKVFEAVVNELVGHINKLREMRI
ncbi:MAG: creatininase family protein [Candidatus Bathyarchaeia archaeon]